MGNVVDLSAPPTEEDVRKAAHESIAQASMLITTLTLTARWPRFRSASERRELAEKVAKLNETIKALT